MPDKAVTVSNNSTTSKVANTATTGFSPIGDLIKNAWELVKLSWKNLLLLSLILYGIVIALVIVIGGTFAGSLFLTGGEFEGPTIVTVLLVIVAALAMMVIGSAFNTAMMLSVAEAEQKPTIGSLISKGLKLFFPVFFTSLLLAFILYGGFLLFVIPGIILAILTGFSLYEAIFSENKYLSAIKNSVRIISQNFGELFIRMLVIIGMVVGLLIVQGILQGLVGRESGVIPLIGFVMTVVQVIFGWFALAYYYLVYKEARALTDFDKKSSTAWIWIVSILGWIIGTFFIVLMSSVIGKVIQDNMNKDNNFDSSGMMENGDFNYGGEVDTEKLLEQYGSEMTEEEKAMFQQIMDQTEANMQQDENAAANEPTP
jgi:hypothetical protein